MLFMINIFITIIVLSAYNFPQLARCLQTEYNKHKKCKMSFESSFRHLWPYLHGPHVNFNHYVRYQCALLYLIVNVMFWAQCDFSMQSLSKFIRVSPCVQFHPIRRNLFRQQARPAKYLHFSSCQVTVISRHAVLPLVSVITSHLLRLQVCHARHHFPFSLTCSVVMTRHVLLFFLSSSTGAICSGLQGLHCTISPLVLSLSYYHYKASASWQ